VTSWPQENLPRFLFLKSNSLDTGRITKIFLKIYYFPELLYQVRNVFITLFRAAEPSISEPRQQRSRDGGNPEKPDSPILPNLRQPEAVFLDGKIPRLLRGLDNYLRA
jgi:hypothetical protein